MKIKSICLAATLCTSVLIFNSCKESANTTVSIDYKYNAEIKLLTNCKIQHVDLLGEAIYSFENDITQAYNKANRNPMRSYQMFINNLRTKKFDMASVASKHSLKIAKALQNSGYYKNGLLDLESEVGACIFDNIKDQKLKTSLTALKNANSLRPNIVLATLSNYTINFTNDKNLTAFLALEYYYNSLMLLEEKDLNTPLETAPVNPNVDFNKVPSKIKEVKPEIKTPTKTGHEGHNH